MSRVLQPFLDKLLARTRLSPEEQKAILDLGSRAERLEARRNLVLSGDNTMSACLVLQGMCGRVETPDEESKQITAVYLPGEMPDLYSVFEPVALHTIEAMVPSIIARIPHNELAALLLHYPAVGEALTRYLVADAAILGQWVVNVGGRDAITRTAHFFCEIAVRLKVDAGASFAFPFRISQVQLADITGLSAVHVNRSLGALRRERLLAVERGLVTVGDWAGLVRAGRFDAGYLRPGQPQRLATLSQQPSTGGDQAAGPRM
jgi:CRP-like cAMP-binding protein